MHNKFTREMLQTFLDIQALKIGITALHVAAAGVNNSSSCKVKMGIFTSEI